MGLVKRKHLLFGIILALSGGAIFAEELAEEEMIRNTYNNVFGTEKNLFNKENNLTGAWRGMVSHLKNYVDDNAGGNKKLHNAFDTCEEISNQLINTLQVIYDDVFERKESDLAAITMARNALRALNDSENNLVVEKEILRKVTFYINREKKNKAREVLLALIIYLEIAIDKLNKSFEAKLRERGWS